MNFGTAIELLKAGMAVARTGWNGKEKYLFYIGILSHGYSGTPVEQEKRKGGWTYTNGWNDNLPLSPFIAMKTADGSVVPWLASQTDILAEDWELVNPTSINTKKEPEQRITAR